MFIRIKEFLLLCKHLSSICFIPSFKQRRCIISDTSVILDMLHLLFVSSPVSVFSSGSAYSYVLDVFPEQRRVGLIVSYQRLQPLCLVQALPIILRPYLQPSADKYTDKQIRLITEVILIKQLKQCDFFSLGTLLFTLRYTK